MDETAKQLRKDVLNMSFLAKACHIGSSLSVIEIVLACSKQKGIQVFSKASGIATVYALTGKDWKHLKENPLCWPGGSLSHGQSISCGIALGDKTKKVYCISSDCEMNEGSFWEAILFAVSKKLNNLYIIIDYNKLQSLDFTENVLKLEPLVDKFKAFGCEVRVVKDGHNLQILERALTYPALYKDKPVVIIAHTIKGYPISFMSNKCSWHYLNLNKKLLKQSLEELDKFYEKQ